MHRILLAIPTGENVPYEVMESIYNLKIPKTVTTELKILRSYSISNGRTDLVNYAIENKFDYIFFIDSDVILPQDSLIKLYDANKYIINGTYPRKELQTLTEDNPWTTLYRHDITGMSKYNFGPFWLSNNELPKNGIIPVDCAGLGCTLIYMDVFTKFMPNIDWFIFAKEQEIIKYGPYCLGEDMYFYRECLRHNIQPYAHGGVRCGHLGKFVYQLPEIK